MNGNKKEVSPDYFDYHMPVCRIMHSNRRSSPILRSFPTAHAPFRASTVRDWTTSGFARLPDSFSTMPTKKPSSFVLPPRKSSTFSGFASRTFCTKAAITAGSVIASRPRAWTKSSTAPSSPPPTHPKAPAAAPSRSFP